MTMTLKKAILHELETANDLLLEDLFQVIRSRKHTISVSLSDPP